jgi:serpin B
MKIISKKSFKTIILSLVFLYAAWIIIILLVDVFGVMSGRNSEAPSIAAANNQFAFDFFARYKSNKNNVFFSPYSIVSAAGMVYEGARGKTADGIQSVFGFPKDASKRLADFASINSDINKPGKSYALSVANALWGQKDYPFNQNYLDTVSANYGGNAANLDFVTDTEGSRQTINDWVAGKTNQKIQNFFPQGSVSSQTKLVLTNAIYFKGKWQPPFDKKETEDKFFTPGWGLIKKTPTMTDEGSEYNYGEDLTSQIIELPYANRELSMYVILPRNGIFYPFNGFWFDNSFNLQKFESLKSSMNYEKADVYLPKFKFETTYEMNKTLSKMGMSAAFSQDADFSGMSEMKGVFINEALHKAYVDEEGTEAAAATGFGEAMGGISVFHYDPPPKIFRADHPFMFVIVHNATGAILFLGKVNNPTE